MAGKTKRLCGNVSELSVQMLLAFRIGAEKWKRNAKSCPG
jgi:hypothetical protein